jgi:hypothetical protein
MSLNVILQIKTKGLWEPEAKNISTAADEVARRHELSSSNCKNILSYCAAS